LEQQLEGVVIHPRVSIFGSVASTSASRSEAKVLQAASLHQKRENAGYDDFVSSMYCITGWYSCIFLSFWSTVTGSRKLANKKHFEQKKNQNHILLMFL